MHSFGVSDGSIVFLVIIVVVVVVAVMLARKAKSKKNVKGKSFFQKMYTENRPQTKYYRNLAHKEMDNAINVANDDNEVTPSSSQTKEDTDESIKEVKKRARKELIIGAIVLAIIVAMAYYLISGAMNYSNTDAGGTNNEQLV
ncbi:MAG: hypothetical protein RSC95_08205 [Anaerovoracaceae bacterium]